MVFSSDGKKVALGSKDGTVVLWDAEKGEAIGSAHEGHIGAVSSIVFSPDGNMVALVRLEVRYMATQLEGLGNEIGLRWNIFG
jgi:WD40 repeat protein